MEFKKDEFKIAMIKNHVTMAEAAEKLGMKTPSLSKRVNGIVEWKLDEIQKVSEVFGRDAAAAIFFGNDVS